MRRRLAFTEIDDPTQILNTSIPIPTPWKIAMTLASSQVFILKSRSPIWLAMAARLGKPYRL